MGLEHFDVLIVGAGLSGIGAAHHLQTLCPQKTYVILDQRERIGGTWDLFRYPGVRSDSDMLTMSYSFRPWTKPTAISPGAEIREYISDTAREEGIDRHIRFGHQIKSAAWSSKDSRWTVEAVRKTADGRAEPAVLTCQFLFCCAGYYRYSGGYAPEFPGAEKFGGRLIHPQSWPADFDYTGKHVVVIGSGATAVTLLPALAEKASHVTMLQRSPTYIFSIPSKDVIADVLRQVLPAKWAYRLTRWKNVALTMYFYHLAKWRPEFLKATILKGIRGALGADYDVAKHFTPRYRPWEQRLCLVPDGDLFEAIRSGRAAVVTDEIEALTEDGILLKSGGRLQADVIISATGLVLQAYGGMELSVDGRRVDIGETVSYKGVMLSGVPNFAAVFGYINASWTLKADLISTYVCRLLNFLDRKGLRQVTPKVGDNGPTAPFVENFSSGYIQRAVAGWPKQGAKRPWRVYQNYFRDIISLKWAPINNGALVFSNPHERRSDGGSRELAEAS